MSPGGVNLVGYLDAVLGQGESARRFGDGLMRGVATDPEAAAARGRRGAAAPAERFAHPIAGAVAARHIERAHAALLDMAARAG